MRLALLALAIATLPIALYQPASADPGSFVYCVNDAGVKVFAGKLLADRNLAFGISVWSPNGHNISVFGIAVRHAAGWEYTDNLQAGTAADRCRLNIVPGGRDTLRVEADAGATCARHGGTNAEIGTVLFPRSAYEGTVTTELDNPETFQRAGKCAGGGR